MSINNLGRPLSDEAQFELVYARLQALEARLAPVESQYAGTNNAVGNLDMQVQFLSGVVAGLGNSGALAITGTLGPAVQGLAYAFTPTVSGGSGTRSFAIAGTLPSGLSFSTTNGAITGTPTVTGTFSGISITVTDTTGSATLSGLSLVVNAALSITGTAPSGNVNTAYTFTPTVTGGSGTRTFSYTGSLPAGLNFSTTNGIINGTPTTAGTSNGISITVTDSTGSATLSGLSITITASVSLAISGTPGTATQGYAYSFTPTVTGGSGTKTFSYTGTLPTGLSFSTSTGAITGTPTATGTFSGISITVTDSSGSASLSGLSIVVTAVTATINGVVNTDATLTATVSSGTPTAYQWQRNIDGFYKPIGGATSSTYSPTSGDGVNIRCIVTVGGTQVTSPPCRYLGQVATRCGFWPFNLSSASQTIANSRSGHFARDDLSSIVVGIPNFAVGVFTSVGTAATTGIEYAGGNGTWTCSIEYPAGTFTQATIGGVTTGNISGAGLFLTDAITVNIPAGAKFWVRTFRSFSSGVIPYTGIAAGSAASSSQGWNGNAQMGDGFELGSTGSDKTMSGTISASGVAEAFFPACILQATIKPSVHGTGDSRMFGNCDIVDSSGDVGEVFRSIGPSLAYINGGTPSDRASYAASNYANRILVQKYCSHGVDEYGVNDINSGGASGPTTQSSKTSIQRRSFALGRPQFASTITPINSDTSGTVTGNDSNRRALNGLIRATPYPLLTYFEVTDLVETARDSGAWQAGKTFDGLHANQAGYLQIKNGNPISATVFARDGSYSPSTGGVNLLSAVNAIDTWTLSGSTVTPNVAVNPISGATDADRLTDSTASAAHDCKSPDTTTSTVSGGTYTVSVDCKYESQQFIQFIMPSATFGSNAYANFDIQNGTVTQVGAAATAYVAPLGNGWFRCGMSMPSNASGVTNFDMRGIPSGTFARGTVYQPASAKSFIACNQQLVTGFNPNAI